MTMSRMEHNTDFMVRYNLAKFILQYVDYFGCAELDSRKKNGKGTLYHNNFKRIMSFRQLFT